MLERKTLKNCTTDLMTQRWINEKELNINPIKENLSRQEI
uniref:Uncharacterized protein n=1 Tax=Nelumbo nucifera TaxID=4432 RepID=A0A822Z6K1_NELNU|nr:TPA_asm: hypothetical protein HUJ06_012918 [Nelumbo nucifera]